MNAREGQRVLDDMKRRYWYGLSGWTAVLGAQLATMWPPPVRTAGIAVIGVALTVAGVTAGTAATSGRRWRRDGIPGLRRQLAAMITERAPLSEAWLNREEHLAFALVSTGRGPSLHCSLIRIDEDDAREARLAAPLEVIAVTSEAFIIDAGEPGYRREVVGALVTGSEAGKPKAEPAGLWRKPAGKRTMRSRRLRYQAERAAMAGAADELRELIRQFQAAEPLERDSGA